MVLDLGLGLGMKIKSYECKNIRAQAIGGAFENLENKAGLLLTECLQESAYFTLWG